MIRDILAIIIGFIVSFVFIFLLEFIGSYIFPTLTEADLASPQAIAEFMQNTTIASILFAPFVKSAGTFVGGFVTALLAVSKRRVAIIFGVLSLFVIGFNFIEITNSGLFTTISSVLPLPMALLGSRMAGSFGD